MTAKRKRWDVNHLSHFTKLLTDQRDHPEMKSTVQFKDHDGDPITLLTTSIKSISKIGRDVYLNLHEGNESIEIEDDYEDARDILHNAYHPPTEYYVVGLPGDQIHYIPVLEVRNLIQEGSSLRVYLKDGTEYLLDISADKFFASKKEIMT